MWGSVLSELRWGTSHEARVRRGGTVVCWHNHLDFYRGGLAGCQVSVSVRYLYIHISKRWYRIGAIDIMIFAEGRWLNGIAHQLFAKRREFKPRVARFFGSLISDCKADFSNLFPRSICTREMPSACPTPYKSERCGKLHSQKNDQSRDLNMHCLGLTFGTQNIFFFPI